MSQVNSTVPKASTKTAVANRPAGKPKRRPECKTCHGKYCQGRCRF